MKQATIGKKEIGKLLHAAASTYKVYAPVAEADDVRLVGLEPDMEPTLEYTNFKRSAKELFFPACELICTYENETLTEAPLPDEKFVVFGVRPCDALALALLDKVFGEFGGSRDPYYMKRRENGLVIALACLEPEDTAFCTAAGSGPAGTDGADILVYDVGKELLFEALSEKGEAFLSDYQKFLGKPGAAAKKARDRIVEKAKARAAELDLHGLKQKLERNFDSPLWKEISEICLGCGLCTYQCPTCHCFDITDEVQGRKGRRIRTWDSCQYALFTHHASGHNPRPSKNERMRQRVLHKFLYTVENLGETFCVGCGRCVRNCPVNLDLRETLKSLQGLSAQDKAKDNSGT